MVTEPGIRFMTTAIAVLNSTLSLSFPSFILRHFLSSPSLFLSRTLPLSRLLYIDHYWFFNYFFLFPFPLQNSGFAENHPEEAYFQRQFGCWGSRSQWIAQSLKALAQQVRRSFKGEGHKTPNKTPVAWKEEETAGRVREAELDRNTPQCRVSKWGGKWPDSLFFRNRMVPIHLRNSPSLSGPFSSFLNPLVLENK